MSTNFTCSSYLFPVGAAVLAESVIVTAVGVTVTAAFE
jgi:hypothetical protein